MKFMLELTTQTASQFYLKIELLKISFLPKLNLKIKQLFAN